MRIVLATIAASIALPLMALAQGQSTEPQQQDTTNATQTQGSADGTKTTAPTKGKKDVGTRQESSRKADAETSTSTDVKGKADVRTQKDAAAGDMSRSETNTRSTSATTEHTNTKVNVQEFKTRHSEVFSLGRHPKEFFVQRFGASHVRLIGHTYFAFVDGCWVAVDVDGFTYTERVICEGDPE